MDRRQHGFNLIEIMTALTVLGILMSLGLPAFTEWIESQRIRASAEAVVNGMQVARAEAIRRNLPVKLVLDPPTTGWMICESTVVPCDPTTLAADLIQSKDAQEGSGNTIVKPAPDGATTVTFSPLGSSVNNFDTTVKVTSVEVTPTDPNRCNSAGGSMRCLRVVVSAGGSIRMCDPTPTVVLPDPRAC